MKLLLRNKEQGFEVLGMLVQYKRTTVGETAAAGFRDVGLTQYKKKTLL